MAEILYDGKILADVETPGLVSDGFHTFDEIDDHRCANFLAWQAIFHQASLPYSGAWKSRLHADGSAFDGWFIAGMTLPGGQISYHLPEKYWDACKGTERDRAPEWDGHSSKDVLERILAWVQR